MHRILQAECPDCQAMMADHERRCQNCGSTAIVDLSVHELMRGERGSWLLVAVLGLAAIGLLLTDRVCGTNLAAGVWQHLTSNR